MQEIQDFLTGDPFAKLMLPKYRLHTVHDDNIGNILMQVFPEFKDLESIKFADSLYFEVWMNTTNATSPEYSVRVVFDGVPIMLHECNGAEYCDSNSFMFHMRRYLSTFDDMLTACYRTEGAMGPFDEKQFKKAQRIEREFKRARESRKQYPTS